MNAKLLETLSFLGYPFLKDLKTLYLFHWNTFNITNGIRHSFTRHLVHVCAQLNDRKMSTVIISTVINKSDLMLQCFNVCALRY